MKLLKIIFVVLIFAFISVIYFFVFCASVFKMLLKDKEERKSGKNE